MLDVVMVEWVKNCEHVLVPANGGIMQTRTGHLTLQLVIVHTLHTIQGAKKII